VVIFGDRSTVSGTDSREYAGALQQQVGLYTETLAQFCEQCTGEAIHERGESEPRVWGANGRVGRARRDRVCIGAGVARACCSSLVHRASVSVARRPRDGVLHAVAVSPCSAHSNLLGSAAGNLT
jgi:hypothetical protein